MAGEWRVLPMGLTNAPATFQNAMNDLFRPYLGKWIVIYIDDLAIFSKTHAEHLEHLRIALQILRDNKYYIKLKKCQWERTEAKFLGHIVGRDGIKVDPDKTKVIADWVPPTNVTQVRSFIGLASENLSLSSPTW